jgi:major vault protein
MPLDETVEELLGYKGIKRDKTRVVTFKCPFNSAVQVYDYKRKKSRVAFGPDLVKLEPDE